MDDKLDGLNAGKNPDRSTWPIEARVCEKVMQLGELLRPSEWWERYQIISGKMGTDCVLSIKVAKEMFKHDPNRVEILQKIRELTELTEEMTTT